MRWIIIFLAIGANTTAALLIKLATSPGKKMPSIFPLNLALSNWALWAGLVVYGLALVAYIWALSVFPVSVAHPVITAGGIALVSLTAILLFGESIGFMGVLGIVLVASGVAFIAAGAK